MYIWRHSSRVEVTKQEMAGLMEGWCINIKQGVYMRPEVSIQEKGKSNVRQRNLKT